MAQQGEVKQEAQQESESLLLEHQPEGIEHHEFRPVNPKTENIRHTVPVPSDPNSASAQFPFMKLCQLFENILNSHTKGEKIGFLEKLWLQLRNHDLLMAKQQLKSKKDEEETETKENVQTNQKFDGSFSSFFTFMRLILPHLDTQRPTYGLKESKIAHHYIELLGLPPNCADAIRFKQWKDPTKNSVEVTHFSDVVFVVLIRRGYIHSSTQPLSVTDVDQKLTALAAATNSEQKRVILMQVLRNTSPLEQKWLIRILLKEMKMHVMHGSILGAFHPSAMELYNNTNDLEYVCKTCTNPRELCAVQGDVRSGIFLMQPLKPMLASVVDSSKLSILLRDEHLVLEPKYDGERMMIHKNGEQFQYWTRNARNYTGQYGPKFDQVLLKGLKSSVNNCILDGEFLLYDAVNKQFHEFGQNRTFATSNVTFEEIDGVKQWFCYALFDIVFLNGESLISLPLTKRKEILKQSVIPRETMLEIVPTMSCHSIPEILSALDTALSNKYEGIMIKIAQSSYTPGERKLKWMKLKPDHISGMADTIDMVILGAYYGTKYGVRHLSHFLLGVLVDTSDATVHDPNEEEEGESKLDPSASSKYHTVCKVGTGYSEQELRGLLESLETKWMHRVTSGIIPPWLDGWKPQAQELPDVFIHPKDSAVLEIFGYSFVETTKFKVGYTLRFPRCHRIRHDKNVADATNLTQLKEIIANSGKFLRKAEALDEFVTVRAKKRQRKEEGKAATKHQQEGARLLVPEQNQSPEHPPDNKNSPMLSSVAENQKIFDGYEFCVLFASPEVIQKNAVERLIVDHGGTIVANPRPQTTSIILVTGTNSAKVRNWIDVCKKDKQATSNKSKKASEAVGRGMEDRYATTDLILVSWFLECLQAGRILALAPRHTVWISSRLQHKFHLTLDKFHDSYYDECSLDTLRDSIQLANQFRKEERDRTASNQHLSGASKSKYLCSVLRQDDDCFMEEAEQEGVDPPRDFPLFSTQRLYYLQQCKLFLAARSEPLPRENTSSSAPVPFLPSPFIVMPVCLSRYDAPTTSKPLGNSASQESDDLENDIEGTFPVMEDESKVEDGQQHHEKKCASLTFFQRQALLRLISLGACLGDSLHKATHFVDARGWVYENVDRVKEGESTHKKVFSSLHWLLTVPTMSGEFTESEMIKYYVQPVHRFGKEEMASSNLLVLRHIPLS